MATWNDPILEQLNRFRSNQSGPGHAVSIKLAVYSGCFHREHSPRAYELIDRHLVENPLPRPDVVFEEHETGPEILAWIAGGVAVGAAVINLVTAIINAKAAGLKKGDDRDSPTELIVRTSNKEGKFVQEVIMKVDSQASVNVGAVKSGLEKAIQVLPTKKAEEPSPAKPKKQLRTSKNSRKRKKK
jgi:hypothetical protein